jgi:tetratricopeptide (TPR) repeat protein
VFNTVYRCFQPSRSWLDVDLVTDVAAVLLGDAEQARAWRDACRVVAELASAATVVEVSVGLLADVAGFTGREGELRALAGFAADDSGAVISVISGMAGVGKTALAVHACHQLVDSGRFADVQLAVNLRGYDPGRPPADPAAVLDGFLRKLGVPGEQIHHLDLAARCAKFRQLLAGRKALILLDNAASADQVRPLLPHNPGCLALITSRRALDGLVGVESIALDVFAPGEAMAYLHTSVGADRIDGDIASATRIAELVGHLPLALTLATARVKAHGDWTLADHVQRLHRSRERLRLDDELEAALALSYADLPAEIQRCFRMLALHPGPDMDPAAAAALAGADADSTRAWLVRLVSDTMLLPTTAGRVTFHDLVRVFATARAEDEDSTSARDAARLRLLDHYLHIAAAAAEKLTPEAPAHRPLPRRSHPPQWLVAPFADRQRAMKWLDDELPNLLAAAESAAQHGDADFVSQMSSTLWRYLGMHAHFDSAIRLHTQAMTLARVAGDIRAASLAVGHLGGIHGRLGRYREAIEELDECIAMARELGDRNTECNATGTIAICHTRLGDYHQAAVTARRALTLAQELGDSVAEGRAASNLAELLERVGEFDEALTTYRLALARARETDDPGSEIIVLNGMGVVLERTGAHDDASRQLRAAKELARQHGYRELEGEAMANLGLALLRMSEHQDAEVQLTDALDIARVNRLHIVETRALQGLAELRRTAGDATQAVDLYHAALDIARMKSDPLEQARAHSGLAAACHDLDRRDDARAHWDHALDIYRDLDVPDAAHVQRQLADLDDPGTRGGRQKARDHA